MIPVKRTDVRAGVRRISRRGDRDVLAMIARTNLMSLKSWVRDKGLSDQIPDPRERLVYPKSMGFTRRDVASARRQMDFPAAWVGFEDKKNHYLILDGARMAVLMEMKKEGRRLPTSPLQLKISRRR